MSGDKNEEQVLNAIEAYTEHRPEITSRAINLLFDIARIERCSQLLRALQVSLGLTLTRGILHSQSFFPPWDTVSGHSRESSSSTVELGTFIS